MKFKINFQYRPSGSSRPYDQVQEDRIEFEDRETALIPAVGDAVIYIEGEQNVLRKVESRTFSYMATSDSKVANYCTLTIVVTDISEKEIAARIKE